jgi:hypothetical protein
MYHTVRSRDIAKRLLTTASSLPLQTLDRGRDVSVHESNEITKRSGGSKEQETRLQAAAGCTLPALID